MINPRTSFVVFRAPASLAPLARPPSTGLLVRGGLQAHSLPGHSLSTREGGELGTTEVLGPTRISRTSIGFLGFSYSFIISIGFCIRLLLDFALDLILSLIWSWIRI